jgi:hypothetical protein
MSTNNSLNSHLFGTSVMVVSFGDEMEFIREEKLLQLLLWKMVHFALFFCENFHKF